MTFEELRELQANWDSYGASPIDPACIKSAQLFLERINIVPCCDGGVSLEWHTHGYDLELSFVPDGTTAVLLAIEGVK
jgi:hypothetical protein